jgi:hypothetical protein
MMLNDLVDGRTSVSVHNDNRMRGGRDGNKERGTWSGAKLKTLGSIESDTICIENFGIGCRNGIASVRTYNIVSDVSCICYESRKGSRP